MNDQPTEDQKAFQAKFDDRSDRETTEQTEECELREALMDYTPEGLIRYCIKLIAQRDAAEKTLYSLGYKKHGIGWAIPVSTNPPELLKGGDAPEPKRPDAATGITNSEHHVATMGPVIAAPTSEPLDAAQLIHFVGGTTRDTELASEARQSDTPKFQLTQNRFTDKEGDE